MADLLGAASGIIMAIVFMNILGTPKATFYSALPVLLAAFITGRTWLKVAPFLLVGLMIFLSMKAETLLKMPRKERASVIYEHWDAMSKIKIYDFDGQYKGINIDNVANSPVYPFDGNWDRPDSMKFDFGINVSYLINQFDSCRFLSLGAGGGVDVLQALQEGATEIHAVEVNQHINDLMVTGELAEYSGRIYHDPRVKVVTEDARAYVRRFENKFDLIYSLSSNTFSALTSGAFALAENYLFTQEAFEDYWRALSDSGFMMMEHQFYVPRLVSELTNGLGNLGVKDATSYFAVYNLPKMRRNILFVSKRPISDDLLQQAFGELTPEKHEHIHLLYPASDSTKGNLIEKIVLNGWEPTQADATIDISPCNDDRPFTAQLGLWKNVTLNKLEKVRPYDFLGFPMSKLMMVIILLVIGVMVIPLNILPYFVTKGEKLKAAPWLYFFAIGMGFMIVEVILMQQFSLFIGPSLYSIVTILLTLLLFSGIGSRFSERFDNRIIFVAIVAWLLLDIFLFKFVVNSLGSLEMPGRIAVTALLIAPLGFFMGMPFPKAGLRVKELIDWGFAVNGAASVFGSTLIILVAISFGFSVSLFMASVLYLAAFGLISMKTGW